MSRQTATLVALGSIAVAALVLSVGSWIQLWRRLRERRAVRSKEAS